MVTLLPLPQALTAKANITATRLQAQRGDPLPGSTDGLSIAPLPFFSLNVTTEEFPSWY